MRFLRLPFVTAFLVSACARETPPHTVDDFLTDRILLEATMVRCIEERALNRYDVDCVNAREAVERIAAAEEQARREALEAESARKRESLRRAREAEEKRRLMLEEVERQRQEAEEFGVFEPLPEEPGHADPSSADEPGVGEERPAMPDAAPTGIVPADRPDAGTAADSGAGDADDDR